ncbi:hypothetical protein DT019_37960 [Streptomyces sp. SDr-06]|uniref:DUF5719 family protein n=1 Tax=Streptomyces sp. SDr-06 TaxID=2267702 RepID=UPI000DEAC46C|nr:DUF5719 family protein [Streptomyces sp. SDr-06]RCH59739.1 hypothetical protein DT019_37960 [Streptomyces sp. SDr-06]
MKRTTLSLAAGAVALAALTGFASLSTPGGTADTGAKTPARLPVERSSLLCPAPSNSDLAQTTYTAFTPKGTGQGKPGTAALTPAVPPPADSGGSSPAPPASGGKPKDGKDGKGKDKKASDKPAPDKPVISLSAPGKPAAATVSGADAPALTGSADGLLAPGWAAQEVTQITGGAGRALLGTSCTAPDADFWFPGASTAKDRQDYVHLTNPDDTAAVADVELFGKDGPIKTDIGEGITIPARSSVPVLLSTLTGTVADDLTVHVATRAGRVGAVVQATDAKAGADWLPASADAAASQVLPGIPGDATDVRLVVYAKGADDADLKVKLLGKGGGFAPAGLDTVHVKSGMTASFDLKNVTRGDAGSLLLTPVSDGSTPVVAALRVVRGTGDKQEIGFIPAAAQVGARATVTDNRDKAASLALTAPGTKDATVKVTSSAGTEGGEPQSKTYTVKAGTTLAVDPPAPSGLKGSYALTVEPDPAGGPVYAARTLALTQDGVPMFTVQTLADDKGTVAVPAAAQDLTVLEK